METPKKTHKVRNTFFLILTALIWGAAFVAQSVSMDYIEPLTFIFLRSLIGGLFLIPCIWMLDWLNRRSEDSGQEAADSREGLAAREAAAGERKGNVRWWTDRQVLTGGIVCGLFLFFCQLFSADRDSVHDRGKSGLYHFVLYYYRAAAGDFSEKILRDPHMGRGGHRAGGTVFSVYE